MSSRGRRRARTSLRVALALALAPLAVTSSAQVAPLAGGPVQRQGPAEPPAAEAPTLVLTSRSAARTALFDALSGKVFGETRARAAVRTMNKGARVWTPSALTDHDLPVAARRAYGRAAAMMADLDPGCQIPWTLLAGIGRVESDHGRHGGGTLSSDGVTRPRIIGLQLDGKGPVAAIRDTDGGRLDGDDVWDRAVGPMQFIPSTWASAARDGDGDGRVSPHDLDDAAAAAATYLCSGGGSLRDPETQAAAIFRYNQDEYYVASVQAFETGYRTGSFVMPPPPVDEEERAEKRRERRRQVAEERRERQQAAAARRARHQAADRREREQRRAQQERREQQAAATPSSRPRPSSSAKPSPRPKPSPSPKSSPSPKPSLSPKPSPKPSPSPTEVEGRFGPCGTGYCLDGRVLDLGVLDRYAERARGDFDGDGVVETNGNEVTGMAGTTVTMVVAPMADRRLGIYRVHRVDSINGIPLV